MTSRLAWAVTDGPDGVNSVELPEDRLKALALRFQHNGRFWCTTQVIGCGDQLLLAAGPIVRPYFRHRNGSACALIGQRSTGPAYEHLQYQLALQQWLAKQGYQAKLEKLLGPDGRTDLHVVIDAVSHILEVQLSPIGTPLWKSRDENYRRHVDHVTWLYGPFAEAAAASELAVRGLALALRQGPEIGVRDVADAVHWVPLDACRLTAEGFFAPGVKEAKELSRRRMADAVQRRRKPQSAGEAWQQPGRTEQYRRTPPPPSAKSVPRSLDDWEATYPEARTWRPQSGWGWLDLLPEQLHRAAQAAAYTAQVLVADSSMNEVLPGLEESELQEQVFAALETANLITRYTHISGLQRWKRT